MRNNNTQDNISQQKEIVDKNKESGIHTIKFLHDKSGGFTMIRNELIQCSKMSITAKMIIIYCKSQPEDWNFQPEYLAKKLDLNIDTLYKYLKEIMEKGFGLRYQQKSHSGRFDAYVYWLCDSRKEINELREEFKEKFTERKFPDAVNSVPTKKETKPIKERNKGNEAALPFSKEKPKQTKQRKFKRPEDQQRTFDWLKTLGLDTDEDTLSYYAYKYSHQKLEDAWSHYLVKTELKGVKPKSSGALFRHILQKEASLINQMATFNREYAEQFAKKKQWHSLEIHEKYVQDAYYSGKDISLNMDREEFAECLQRLFESITS